jgi:hypothetical protein
VVLLLFCISTVLPQRVDLQSTALKPTLLDTGWTDSKVSLICECVLTNKCMCFSCVRHNYIQVVQLMVFLNENPDDMHTCNMYTVLHTRNPSNFLRTYFSIMIQCAHCTMGCVSLSDRRTGSACASSCNPFSFPFSSPLP